MNGAPSRGSGSGGSGSASGDTEKRPRKLDEAQQASAIEKSVTHLLVATKQLLETLTQWSRGSASETDVSDVYVRLGYEFNIACRAFNGVNIDTSDLGNVPETLRHILEETLSQEASQPSLDRFLPRIRDIIINLLHGLKRKQQKLRQRSINPDRTDGSGGFSKRDSSIAAESSTPVDVGDTQKSAAVTRNATYASRPESVPPNADPRRTASTPRHGQQQVPTSVSDPGMPSANNQKPPQPTLTIPDQGDPPEIPNNAAPVRPARPPDSLAPPPAPPVSGPPSTMPRKQQDALAALQRGGDLERRASRRFSAYQIQKHLGTPSSSVPMIPPAQRSLIPNRGPEIRESMNAMRSRGTDRAERGKSVVPPEATNEPETQSITSIRHSLRDIPQDDSQNFAPPVEHHEYDSPHVKTPDDKYGKPPPFEDKPTSASPMRATITRWDDSFPVVEGVDSNTGSPDEPRKTVDLPAAPSAEVPSETLPIPVPEPARQSGVPEALTLFLQYKTKVKKYVLPGGYPELTIPRLQLAFIDKFSWNTHSNGVDLPEIYLQDPASGVRHELEDLQDIKDRSVLVLNVDGVDEVKRHFDDSLGGLRDVVESIKTAVSEQQSALQRVTQSQQDAAKDLARVSAIPAAATTTSSRPSFGGVSSVFGGGSNNKATARQKQELETLRRDLAVLRQTFVSARTEMESNMSKFRAKATAVKEAAAKTAQPSAEGGSGRAYIDAGKKSLTDDSEKLISRVDDLQDTIEDLRKDVAGRGVRILPRQLEQVSSDIASATVETRRLRDYLKQEKPVWNKIAEQELQAVYDDQETMRIQEELVTDLEDDLLKLSETFTLVEEVQKQQTTTNGASRSTSRTIPVPAEDPHKAKDTVLGEVRALQPNHENRLEAIERAERNRLVELNNRQSNVFKQELGSFVEESKLKKTGGYEEVERLRIVREESARKENFERLAARQMGLEYEPDVALFGSQQEAEAEEEVEYEDDGLEVPHGDDDGLTSPEGEFLEAEEAPFPVPGGGGGIGEKAHSHT